MTTSDKKEVLKNIAAIMRARKFIISLAPNDISELSDELYVMMNITLRQLFLHTEAKYGVLNQSDFDQIFEKLLTLKSPTQEYSALAEFHRDLHSLLAGAGQGSTEYSKTQYLLQALQNDPTGKYAIEIFLRTFPAIPDHIFEDLVEILILHAPTFIPTTSALDYSNPMAITGTSSAIMAAPFDAAGLAQLLFKHQKELSAMNKKIGVPRPRFNTATSMATRKVTLALTAMFPKPMHYSSTLRSISLPRITITPLVEISMSAVDDPVKVFA